MMLFAFIGFFAGVLFAALQISYNLVVGGERSNPVILIFAFFVLPFATSINAAVIAAAGYPIYKFVANRYLSQSLTGFTVYYSPYDDSSNKSPQEDA